MELHRPAVLQRMTQIRQSPFAPQQLIELRSKGMHAVRFEFIKRLMDLNTQSTTLTIYWEDGRNFFQIPKMQNAIRKLVFASVPRVSGKFNDVSLICYDRDAQARATVNAELDRMVASIRDYQLKQQATIA